MKFHTSRTMLALSSPLLASLFSVNIAYADPIEVIVIEGRLDETLSLKQAQNGISMVSINRDQIDQAGTSDLNSILQQYVPELTVIAKNGRYDYATYSLQGSRPEDILWLVDGIRINNRLFGGGYLDTISTAMIEHIEVLKAGQGVMYGTDAVAGVINIITRSYQGRDEGELSVGIDSLGSTQFNGYASNLIGDVAVTVFGASDQSSGFSPWRDSDYHWTATDRERGYDVQNVGAKLAWQNDATSITMMAQYNQADLDYLRPYFNVETQNKRKQTLLTLSVDSALNNTTQALVKAYYHNWDTDYFRLYQMNDGSLDLKNNNSYWGFSDTGVKGWLEGHLNQHLWTLGVEYQQYKGRDEVINFSTDTEQVIDVFGQFKPRFNALPTLNSTVGFRYSTINNGESALIGEASARYELNNQWQLSINGGNSFRLPTAEQLYATEDSMGNRELKPEKGTNINAGVQFTHSNIQINTNLFWRQVNHLIGSAKDANDQWNYVNVDKQVNTQGIGTSADWNINQQLSSQFGISYTDINDQNNAQTLLNIPNITANWHLAFDHSQLNYGLWSNVIYIGSMEAYDINYGKYALIDIGGYYIFGHQQQHKLQLKIENIMNTAAETGVFKPGSDAPADYQNPVTNISIPRNAQLSYSYYF